MLHDLQQQFRDVLLGQKVPDLDEQILPDDLTADARLQVYRNHIAISLRAALRSTFPVVHRLVGEEFFAVLARHFIVRHPPASPCLSEFGAALPAFIANFPAASSLPYLADVAKLEWGLHRAWHGPLEIALDAARLAEFDPDQLTRARVRLQPTLQILTSASPFDLIWRANQPDSDGSGVDLVAGGCSLLIWREGEDAVFERLSPEAGAFVLRLMERRALGETFCLPEAAHTFARLLSAGLIVGMERF